VWIGRETVRHRRVRIYGFIVKFIFCAGTRHQYVLGKAEDEEALRQQLKAWSSAALDANQHKKGSVLDSQKTKKKAGRERDMTLYPSLEGKLTYTRWTKLSKMQFSAMEAEMRIKEPIDPQDESDESE
jgi:hypothetical protein